MDRYWKGPAKVVLKDRKSLHCVMSGNPLIINSDDVLLNKPNDQEIEVENLISLPTNQQPPLTTTPEQSLQQEPEVVETANASVPQIYDAQKESELVLQGGTEATSQVSQSDNNQQPANSDIFI